MGESSTTDEDLFILMNSLNEEKAMEEERKAEFAYKFSEWLRIAKLTIGCLLLIGGCFGNFLTFSVFRRQALRPYVTSFLLSVLALSNIVVLVLGLLPKMIEYEMKADLLRTSIPYFCQIQVFLLYTFLHFSSWTLVFVTLERFLSVWLPERSVKLCTVRNAKFATSMLLLVQLTYNAQLLVTMEAQPIQRIGGPLPSNYADELNNQPMMNNSSGDEEPPPIPLEMVCDSRPEYSYFHDRVFPIIHIAVFCFIPFVVMLVLNGMIAGRLLLLGNQVLLAATPNSGSAVSQGRRLSDMTTTMFACSLSFFAFTLPVSLYIVVRRSMEEAEARRNMSFYVMWTVLNLAQYVNNATPFFYCLFGSLFRRELMRMLVSFANACADFCCGKNNDAYANGAASMNGNNGHIVAVENGVNDAPEQNCEQGADHLETTAFSNGKNRKLLDLPGDKKSCRMLLIGDSEASGAQQYDKSVSTVPAVPASNTGHRQSETRHLLEQFGPNC